MAGLFADRIKFQRAYSGFLPEVADAKFITSAALFPLALEIPFVAVALVSG